MVINILTKVIALTSVRIKLFIKMMKVFVKVKEKKNLNKLNKYNYKLILSIRLFCIRNIFKNSTF
jgi:hypothetical protein